MAFRGERPRRRQPVANAFVGRAAQPSRAGQGRALRLWMVARLRADRMTPEHAAAAI